MSKNSKQEWKRDQKAAADVAAVAPSVQAEPIAGECAAGPPCPICGNGEQHGHGEPVSMSSDGSRIALRCVACGFSWMHSRRPVDDYRRCKACWPKRGGVYVATSTQVMAGGEKRRYYKCAKCGYKDSVELVEERVTQTRVSVKRD